MAFCWYFDGSRLLSSIQSGFDGEAVSGDESDQDGLEESPVKKKPPAGLRNPHLVKIPIWIDCNFLEPLSISLTNYGYEKDLQYKIIHFQAILDMTEFSELWRKLLIGIH